MSGLELLRLKTRLVVFQTMAWYWMSKAGVFWPFPVSFQRVVLEPLFGLICTLAIGLQTIYFVKAHWSKGSR